MQNKIKSKQFKNPASQLNIISKFISLDYYYHLYLQVDCERDRTERIRLGTHVLTNIPRHSSPTQAYIIK